ncbi:hypothetical protein SAMN05421839_14022 [Halolactibacillus halophilus]|uniref:Sporulation and spore germination n=1 Tax=Halolactibacillus halophilus TaxID=306540 RepID=A0A1I5S904_9BACI|nr:hypothetical protein [Halolactibacillus halophilus]GEM02693.1 hypothetical protein HHA03_22250 [Halolactibacillus halophilus]SFP67169.1 hypothetical protein SAMN05421839_14022 [Halolactibacillus halophilus]
MKKLLALLLIVLVTIVACNTPEEPTDSDIPADTDIEQPTDEEPEDDTEVESDDVSEEDDGYQAVSYETIVPVVTHVFDENDEMMFIHMETSPELLEPNDALMMSLQMSDQTTSEAFSQLQTVEIEESEATLHFDGPQPFVSLASAEHMILDQMFNQIGAFYNIDTFNFIVDDEAGIDYGQVGFIEDFTVETLDVTGVVQVTDDSLLENVTPPAYRPIREMVPLQLDAFEETLNKTHAFEAPESFSNIFNGVELLNVTDSLDRVTVTVTAEKDDAAFIEALAIMATEFDYVSLVIINETTMTETDVTLY